MSSSLSSGRMNTGLSVFMLVALLVGLAGLPLVAAGSTPQVMVSNHQEILFKLALPIPVWRESLQRSDGQPTWEAALQGFSNRGTPGLQRVPRSGGWIVVPPGTTPQLEVVAESWQTVSENRPLAIEPVPVMLEDPAMDGFSEHPLIPRPDEELPLDWIPAAVLADMQRPDPALMPGPAARLGEPVWWRGRRIVAYTMLPLRVDGEGRAREVLRHGEWRVRFLPDAGAGKNAPPAALRRQSGKSDGRFGGYFLNGNLLPQLATEGSHVERTFEKVRRPVSRGRTLNHPEIRIPVRRTELLRVRASELQTAGLLPPEAVRQDQLRLYQRRYLPQLDDPLSAEIPPYLEIEVPIYVIGEGDAFGPDALFLFWGLRPRDDRAFSHEHDGVTYLVPAINDTLEISNENNIYWLQFADPDLGESWARMDTVSLPAAAGVPETSYRRTDYYNEALVYREKVPSIHIDRYYYNRDRDLAPSVGLHVWSPVPGQSGAVLQAGIANHSNDARTYRMDLIRGGEVLATLPVFSSSSRDILTYEVDVPPSVMTGESFSLRMRASRDNDWVNGYLDWIKVHYDALYAAPFGRLLFPGGDEVVLGNLHIPGFSTDDIGLIELTDPRHPAIVELDIGGAAANVIADGDGFMLSLQIDQSNGPRRFYAAVRMTSNGVPDIRYTDARLVTDPVVPTRLRESGADVLVVAHPAFWTETEAWVEYRRSRAGAQGLTFQVLEPQDLYDWYSGGLKDPWAIKRFVDHGVAAWGSWAMVLVGSANENPREIGVLSSGRQWSRDWVPTHVHRQHAGSNLAPEVLPSDKWFASQSAGDADYPDQAGQPTDLYVGRLPVHTPAELQRILTKIQQVENKMSGQDWRRRGIFMADDAYGTGTLGGGGSMWSNMGETAFETSETAMASVWDENPGQVELHAHLVLLRTPFMEGLYPEAPTTLGRAREWCHDSGAPQALIAALSLGGTLAHFQGHSNHWLMTHEIWFKDDRRMAPRRRDVELLTNHGKPWLFCGMGCHLGRFIQNVADPGGTNNEPGLSEKLLLWTDAGAVAAYASGGYEYLSANRNLSETFIRRMIQRPPHTTVHGEVVASRWMLGELMWAAEADLLAQANTQQNRQVVHQYVLLGDPLLRLDAGLPEVEALLLGEGGDPLPDLPVDLVAIDETNHRTLKLRARDEAGIDRLLVLDSDGGDLTSSVVVEETPYYTNGSRQIMDYELRLPVRPFPHDLYVRVYDSAAPLDSDAHVLLTFSVKQEEAVFLTQTGEPIDPATFRFLAGQPVDLMMTITSAAWFTDLTSVVVGGQNLDITDVLVTVLDNHSLQVGCTATLPAGKAKSSVDRGLILTINGYSSFVPLELGAIPDGEALISSLVNYPNPMRGATHFVFKTGLMSGRGEVRVWTVSGRVVTSVPFTLSGGGQERVPWDGRDRYGDRLANGTYLYRVELAGSAGQGRSDMQRLVIMR